jgi:hypothetical protein
MEINNASSSRSTPSACGQDNVSNNGNWAEEKTSRTNIVHIKTIKFGKN